MAKDSVDKTQEEIIEEMAKALGHTGYKLEVVLEEMKKMEREMQDLDNIDEYNEMVENFNTLRRQALNRKEMLMIHREALGVYKHNYIDKYYPIPHKKEKKPV
jgi:DNA topoisomerase VI subunit B